MKAGSLLDAAREGHPAVIAVGVLLLLAAVVGAWLWRARRTIPPQARPSKTSKRGRRTVDEITARLDAERLAYEDALLSKINEERRAELKAAAEREAAEATDTIPAIAADAPTESIPPPRRPVRRTRPYLKLVPRPMDERSGVAR